MLTLLTSDGYELILDTSEIVALKAQEDHTVIYMKSGLMFGVHEHISNLRTALAKIQTDQWEPKNVERSLCYVDGTR